MIDFATELEEKMHQRNFHINGKINYSITGEWQRFSDFMRPGKRSRDLFVILHNYDRGATFGDWHYPDDWYTHWNSNLGMPTINDMKERKLEMDKMRREKEFQRSRASWRANEFWHRHYISQNATNHPYVLKKRIIPYYARQVRSWLLIPLHDIDHEFKSIQIIKPDGFKRCWKKTSYKGCMAWLCDKLPDNYNGVIRVCEGYATGCTIHYVTKSPVVCALSAQQLPDTLLALQKKFPRAMLKICADNDQWGKENSGFIYALNAASQTGATIFYPTFEEIHAALKPTDFNDLFLLSGREIVKRQLILIRGKR